MHAFLSRLSVGGKLVAGFGAVLLALVLVGGFAIVQLSKMYESGHRVVTDSLPSVRETLLIAEATARYRAREFRLMLCRTEDERKITLARLAEGMATVEKHRKLYEPLIAVGKERELYQAYAAAWNEYLATSQQGQAKFADGDTAAASEIMMKDAMKKYDVVAAALHDLSEFNDNNAEHTDQDAAIAFSHARWGIGGASLLAVAAALTLGMLIRSAVVPPLQRALTLARAVAGGDLTHSLDAQGHDEVAELTRALGGMVDRLRDLVGEVRLGVESVSTASSEIATGNHDLSARTEQAASNLQETASSMEHLTTTVGQAADTARQANQLAGSATQAAQHGSEVVTQVVSNMDQITASSRKISDIISVIDGIAFQTNILALNAAVEAARAGEQGRGFAVVASEVRNLAQRSANAAREIKTLIGASVETVESGARLVGDAGQAMQDIMQSVQRVSDLMAEISAATNEQRDGIGQVNTAVNHLDQMTQQNAALVEQSAAAASSLSEQAARLHQVVSIFNVGSGVAKVAPSPVVVSRPAANRPAMSSAANTSPGTRPTSSPAASHPTPRVTPVKSLPAPAPKAAPSTPAARIEPALPAPVGGDSDWETF
jgi:methyl-accepting chemotaxis protein